jgi:selenium metabolism protein YedF
MKILDMRGQACPIPVVNAKKVLAEPDSTGATVLVDNITAVQNLEKMAKGTGCGFSYAEDGASQYRVTIVKGSNAVSPEPAENVSSAPPERAAPENGGLVVLITSDSMGRGSEELGKILVKGFIFSLAQLTPPPSAVIFLNAGARLTAEGANTVPDLKVLAEKGADIYTCGTCANYYKLTESLAVGSIVDMMLIANRLAKASRIVAI